MAAKKKDLGSGKPRHAKLDVKPGQSVALVGRVEIGNDLKLLAAKKVADVAAADWIFVAIDDVMKLGTIGDVRLQMQDEAGIWAVWPKGVPKVVNEENIRQTALALDLVDVKVMSWSSTHSGLKLVVRKELRGKKKAT